MRGGGIFLLMLLGQAAVAIVEILLLALLRVLSSYIIRNADEQTLIPANLLAQRQLCPNLRSLPDAVFSAATSNLTGFLCECQS
jgi:hypothetical protein